MSTRSIFFLCATAFLFAGCTPHSPIDAKKTTPVVKENNAKSKSASSLLTDKDIFGNETTLNISEEDIQAALEGEAFRVPLNSPIILVQSGSRAPEAIMQQEMSKYYTVATFSGIPDRQKTPTCNKDKNKNDESDVANSEILTGCRHCAILQQKDIRKQLLFIRIRYRLENITQRQK